MTAEIYMTPTVCWHTDTDWQKLYVLAEWFDMRDNETGFIGERKVQIDLRRIAQELEERDK